MGRFVLTLAALVAATQASHGAEPAATADGYRGIWYSIGQANAHGPKYSGGLATYTCSHAPMGAYSAKANKTFFTYGGTDASNKRLILMASCFDHATGRVPRPTIVRDCGNFSDAHANPSLAIDEAGHVWVFASQRHALPGQKYRSRKPLDVSAFDLVETKKDFAYVSAWPVPGEGLLLPLTKYTGGRELYWQTWAEGSTTWSADRMLATEGHYHVSGVQGRAVGVAFNWHPGGNLDRRTNLYYTQTSDFGKTWNSASGEALTLPLQSWPTNPALVHDYQSEKLLVYTHDLNFDADGRPVILFLTSRHHAAGPDGGDRQWRTARWTGTAWDIRNVAVSDHNYDTGCLHIEPDGVWHIIGPTAVGPTRWGTGGEMMAWTSRDRGRTWTSRPQTAGSAMNHSYARRPKDAHADFYALWADGDPLNRSASRLYFTTKDGKVYQLPERMTEAFATPRLVILSMK